MLSLSQTGLVLSIGQSITITASNLNSSSLYQSSNSNPQIANLALADLRLQLQEILWFYNRNVCLISNTSNCSSVYVIVQNSNAQPLTFSQSSILYLLDKLFLYKFLEGLDLIQCLIIQVKITVGDNKYFRINNYFNNNKYDRFFFYYCMFSNMNILRNY